LGNELGNSHANGKLNAGRHIQFPLGTMMSRMFLTVMDVMGVEQDNFAGSHQKLSEIVAT
jgi:hypothetical protein